MIKFIFLFITLSGLLFSANVNTERRIYQHILHALYPHKESIAIWSDDQNKKDILQNIPKVKLVKTPQQADFVLLHKKKGIDTKGLIFVTDYHLLKYYDKDAIGGFYWQKGRPNILFLKQNLKKHHIKLPADMQEYVEDTL